MHPVGPVVARTPLAVQASRNVAEAWAIRWSTGIAIRGRFAAPERGVSYSFDLGTP